jgi:hypothetical protein
LTAYQHVAHALSALRLLDRCLDRPVPGLWRDVCRPGSRHGGLPDCRHLFEMAGSLGNSDALARVLNNHFIVRVIGPVCAAALRAKGITPDVIPAHPKMGPLIAALADYVELSDDSHGSSA